MNFPSHTRRAIRRSLVVAFLLAAMLTLACGSTASAKAPGCSRIQLAVSGPVAADGWADVHGRACEGSDVQIETVGGPRRRLLGSVAVQAGGRFSSRLRIPLSHGRAVLRASNEGRRSRPVKVYAPRPTDSEAAPAPVAQPAPATPQPPLPTPVGSPPAEPMPEYTTPGEVPTTAPSIEKEEEAEAVHGHDPSCPLAEPEGVITTDAVSGCRLVGSDTANDPNLKDFWGRADCGVYPNALEPNRPEDPRTGGDEHPTATGEPQPDSAYRLMTSYDGDNIAGARCELGLNDIESGPTVYFHEGMHRATFFSERLPENFSLNQPYWQTVFQMKQTQPSVDADVGPMIEMQAENNRWIISREWHVVWSFPARKNFWTRFVFNVVYSKEQSVGSIQVGVDLNGDGDFTDPEEMSPVIHGATLATQIAPGYPTPVGAAIPSHLRAGIYHDTRYSCPRPTGCSVDVDNVQVVAP